MSLSPEELDHDRLLDAADAVLKAVAEVAQELNGCYVHPPRLMGSIIQPECLGDFSLGEVEDATVFLVRLGILPDHFLTI